MLQSSGERASKLSHAERGAQMKSLSRTGNLFVKVSRYMSQIWRELKKEERSIIHNLPVITTHRGDCRHYHLLH